MKKLVLDETKQSPKVELDPENGIFAISGNSFPNNSFRFYLPVLEWLDEYVKQPNKQTHFSFRISYQNSSSIKMFTEIIKKFETLHLAGHEVSVVWFYLENDDDLLQKGKEMRELFKLPFTCKPYTD